MIKRAIVAGSLCLTLLAGTTVLSAPRTSKTQPTKPLPLDVIRVSTGDGGRGGFKGGAGSSWTLRSNDTMDHSEEVNTFDSVALGAESVFRENGMMPPGSYAQMLGYLQWTRLLDFKSPASDGGGVDISLVRGGKTKRIHLAYGSKANVDAAIWTTMRLLNSLEAEIDWKNKEGLSLNTALFFRFASAAEGLPQFTSLTPPSITVLDVNGKEVGTASVYSAAYSDKIVARPGTYRLRVNTTPEYPTPRGYIWRATPETVIVSAGKTTDVEGALHKTAVVP